MTFSRKNRSFRRGYTPFAVALTAVLVLASCSKSDSTTSTGGASTSTSTVKADALGPAKKATGTPVKLGVVVDGASDAIDNTTQLDAAKAAVAYANDHLGGLNGHVVELSTCKTGQTPAGGTKCGVQMVEDKVAAVLVPASGQDAAIYKALGDSGIPYFTMRTANTDILKGKNAYVLSNPLGAGAAIATLAKKDGADKAGFLVIDVPAATGPIKDLATPIFKKAGIGLEIIPLSPSVADYTPQVQQALGDGADIFAVFGIDATAEGSVKALRQLGYKDRIVLSAGSLTPDAIASIPGGAENVTVFDSTNDDPDDADVALFNAVMSKYAKDAKIDSETSGGYIVTMALLKALTGASSASDASSVAKALSAMPKALDVPLGSGLTFQCGQDLVPDSPSVCVSDVVSATLGADGKVKDRAVVHVSN